MWKSFTWLPVHSGVHRAEFLAPCYFISSISFLFYWWHQVYHFTVRLCHTSCRGTLTLFCLCASQCKEVLSPSFLQIWYFLFNWLFLDDVCRPSSGCCRDFGITFPVICPGLIITNPSLSTTAWVWSRVHNIMYSWYDMSDLFSLVLSVFLLSVSLFLSSDFISFSNHSTRSGSYGKLTMKCHSSVQIRHF